MKTSRISIAAVAGLAALLSAKADKKPADKFATVTAPVVALEHARVIDGLGSAPAENQTIVIKDGRIAALGADGSITVPADAQVIDLSHKTVLPGYVMLHEHLYYSSILNGPFHTNEMEFSFPRLYLAAGVTSARTTGSLEPYTDLKAKDDIDSGLYPGPKLHMTLPYIDGEGTGIGQIRPVKTPAAAVRMVDYWADEGFTSAKVYINLPSDIMGAAIAEAHKRGLQVTGHIGKVSYSEAADLGIDNLEHGFMAMSDFIAGRKPGDPSNPVGTYRSLEVLNPDSPEVNALIQKLVAKHVAVTSTLAIFETFTPGRRIDGPEELAALAPPLRDTYLTHWAAVNAKNNQMVVHALAKNMALEMKFYRAGGLLVVGTDPTGYGGVIAGYGNWRAIELLVEEGLTPVEAIKVATMNGAKVLGIDRETGSVEVGKAADLVVVDGNPAASISDIRKARTVFKDGEGFDTKRLIDSAAGSVGIQ
ncbi:MAG TPA: amidohydrolase family protein [Opitutaceae bacterium]|nr:amidohydrolase family protein [Opitutaceae bacterium]